MISYPPGPLRQLQLLPVHLRSAPGAMLVNLGDIFRRLLILVSAAVIARLRLSLRDRFRCRMHGGTSTGTANGNKNALKHGLVHRRSNRYAAGSRRLEAVCGAGMNGRAGSRPFSRVERTWV